MRGPITSRLIRLEPISVSAPPVPLPVSMRSFRSVTVAMRMTPSSPFSEPTFQVLPTL